MHIFNCILLAYKESNFVWRDVFVHYFKMDKTLCKYQIPSCNTTQITPSNVMVQYFATVLVIYMGNDETYDSLEHHSGTVRELFNDLLLK